MSTKATSTKTLLLIDFENEWTIPTSPYYVGDLKDLITKINQLIDSCRNNNYKIIFITHIEKDSDIVFKENSNNIEIIPSLHKLSQDILIKKYKISPFYQTTLEQELQGITELVIAGILTNLCVRSTIHDAYDREFKITVITDCCTTFDPKTHDFTIQDLKATREEIIFLPLKEFLQQ